MKPGPGSRAQIMRGTPPQKGDCPLMRGTWVLFTLHHNYRKKNQTCKKQQWCLKLWSFIHLSMPMDHVHAPIYKNFGLIAEYPNKFVCKRWQTQRFIIRYIINVKRWHANPTFCSPYIIYASIAVRTYLTIYCHGRTYVICYLLVRNKSPKRISRTWTLVRSRSVQRATYM